MIEGIVLHSVYYTVQEGKRRGGIISNNTQIIFRAKAASSESMTPDRAKRTRIC